MFVFSNQGQEIFNYSFGIFFKNLKACLKVREINTYILKIYTQTVVLKKFTYTSPKTKSLVNYLIFVKGLKYPNYFEDKTRIQFIYYVQCEFRVV